MLCIEVDFRERENDKPIVEMFQEAIGDNAELSVKSGILDVGDYRITYKGECVWLAERKTVSDLLASFGDTRYREQKARLNMYAEENPHCKVCYLLEGPEFCSSEALKHSDPRFTPAFLAIANSRKLGCICRASTADTVTYVCSLAMQYKKWRDSSTKPRDITHSKPSLSKKDCKTPSDSAVAALTAIEGVSVERSKAILKTFGSLGHLARATRAQIAAVTVESLEKNAVKTRRIGPKVAERIETVFSARHNGFAATPPPVEDAEQAKPPPAKKRPRKDKVTEVIVLNTPPEEEPQIYKSLGFS